MNILTVLMMVFLWREGTATSVLSVCEVCVSRKAHWWPTTWCTLDKTCHVRWSPENPCSNDESVQDIEYCPPDDVKVIYDAGLSYKLLLLSAVAYSDQPQKCLEKLRDKLDYEVVETVVRKCDGKYFKSEDCHALIAISHQQSALLVAFRGTQSNAQLIDEMLSTLTQPEIATKIGGKVNAYFQGRHDKLYPCVAAAVKRYRTKYPSYTVKVTGYSLGAALASIASGTLVHDKIVPPQMMSLYTYGMPRVGNEEYALNHDNTVKDSWRVVYYKDCVPHLPPCAATEALCAEIDGYYHHGMEVFYPERNMTTRSKYTVCIADEDPHCSNRIYKITDLFNCPKYHGEYFNLTGVSKLCPQILGRNVSNGPHSYQQNYVSRADQRADQCTRIKSQEN